LATAKTIELVLELWVTPLRIADQLVPLGSPVSVIVTE
jgi:hypothetical protein